jgi:hypothetical protein
MTRAMKKVRIIAGRYSRRTFHHGEQNALPKVRIQRQLPYF